MSNITLNRKMTEYIYNNIEEGKALLFAKKAIEGTLKVRKEFELGNGDFEDGIIYGLRQANNTIKRLLSFEVSQYHERKRRVS